METGLNASACVGKQPIMVATASTEHPIGCKHATQAIAFGWKPGYRLEDFRVGSVYKFGWVELGWIRFSGFLVGRVELIVTLIFNFSGVSLIIRSQATKLVVLITK